MGTADIARFHRNSQAVLADCGVYVALFAERLSKTEVPAGIVVLERNGRSILQYGFIDLAQTLQLVGQRVVSLYLIGVFSDVFAKGS